LTPPASKIQNQRRCPPEKEVEPKKGMLFFSSKKQQAETPRKKLEHKNEKAKRRKT